MKREFLGLSDDGFKVYNLFTPGEFGDCGIVLVAGYRGDEFKIFSAEPWADESEQSDERVIQKIADNRRNLQNVQNSALQGLMAGITFGYGNSKGAAKSAMSQNVQVVKGRFSDLERRAAKLLGGPVVMFFDEYSKLAKPSPLSPEAQGQPNRKPQPNRGPIGRKDWK